MGIGITDEHEALRQAVRRWVDDRCAPPVVRAALDAPVDALPACWGSLVEQGWLGLAVSEARGGDGYGLPELAVVLEELGRACAPGPFLPAVHAALLLDALGGPAADLLVPAIVAGELVATVATSGALSGDRNAGGELVVSGEVRPVVGGHLADVLILPVRTGGDGTDLVVVDRAAVDVAELPSLDPTRRVAVVRADAVAVAADRQLGASAEPVATWLSGVLYAAEAVGLADWCIDTASSYAKVREQFGRPIGQFQAVKHRCADMLCATELARAATWDAARPAESDDERTLTGAIAAGLAVDAAADAAKGCVQVLGGIGFTWEHDAHVYLRRATALRAALGGSEPSYAATAALAAAGVRRRLTLDLPPEAEHFRAEVAAFASAAKTVADRDERRRQVADAGYVMPHWPAPWGRDAGPLEQLVIDEELTRAGVRRPHLQVGAWVLPTLIAHGTPEQQERFIRPTFYGDLTWCQLFSEPGAGSDLAGLATKAARTDGGWLLSGQKVWTTMAHEADWGICLARTNPDAPKHAGITCFLVDMRTEGLDIRPLRELTGAEMFNEVFLSDVFVPDDCVVGAVDDGWRVGRTTLANERVSMGNGSSFGFGFEVLMGIARDAGHLANAHVAVTLGRLAAEELALAVLGFRMTLRALSGAEPGPESSVRKLLGVEHDQRVQETGMAMYGADAAALDGDAAMWTNGFLANRCLTIAGGTSEVQRNVIAERLLGLPRDP